MAATRKPSEEDILQNGNGGNETAVLESEGGSQQIGINKDMLTALIERDRKARMQRVRNEIELILQQENCRMVASVTIRGSDVSSIIEIIAN